MIATEPLREGATVCFVGASGWNCDGNVPTTLTGLFCLIEREYADRSVGQYESGWTVCREDGQKDERGYYVEDEPTFFVADDVLWEQTDPQGFGRYLADERWICDREPEDEDR